MRHLPPTLQRPWQGAALPLRVASHRVFIPPSPSSFIRSLSPPSPTFQSRSHQKGAHLCLPSIHRCCRAWGRATSCPCWRWVTEGWDTAGTRRGHGRDVPSLRVGRESPCVGETPRRSHLRSTFFFLFPLTQPALLVPGEMQAQRAWQLSQRDCNSV